MPRRKRITAKDKIEAVREQIERLQERNKEIAALGGNPDLEKKYLGCPFCGQTIEVNGINMCCDELADTVLAVLQRATLRDAQHAVERHAYN